jgi:hypothetical protein
VKQSGVEKIGRQTAGLGLELTKFEYPGLQGKGDKLMLALGFHG